MFLIKLVLREFHSTFKIEGTPGMYYIFLIFLIFFSLVFNLTCLSQPKTGIFRELSEITQICFSPSKKKKQKKTNPIFLNAGVIIIDCKNQHCISSAILSWIICITWICFISLFTLFSSSFINTLNSMCLQKRSHWTSVATFLHCWFWLFLFTPIS